MPDWPTAGVPVLIHLLGDTPRTFAVFSPAVTSHTGVLNCAGVTSQWGYRVYIRDLPWPIPEQGTVPVEPGDLLTISPPGHYHIPGLSLSDILQWTYGRAQTADPPGLGRWDMVAPDMHPVAEATLYALDLRPVLLPLAVMHVLGDRIDVASPHDRLAARCPSR